MKFFIFIKNYLYIKFPLFKISGRSVVPALNPNYMQIGIPNTWCNLQQQRGHHICYSHAALPFTAQFRCTKNCLIF